MKLTIKGITASTIMFNSLNLIIRGDSRYPDLYKESVARHIEVVNEDQLSEVNSLVNAGLILVENEDEIKKVSDLYTERDKISVISSPTPNPMTQNVPENNSNSEMTQNSVNNSNINNDDGEIEDAPSKSSENLSESEEVEKKSTNGRGRPKGAKNRKTIEKEQESGVVTPKKIVKRTSSSDTPKETDDIESSVVVMTPSGAKGGNMVKNASGDIGESEMTKASLEAMEKIEAEEKADRESDNSSEISNLDLDMSEQTGLSAVVSSDGNAKKVKMESSILPEASQIKDRAVNFIDDEGDIDEIDAFVDGENNTNFQEESNIDEEEDPFLEI